MLDGVKQVYRDFTQVAWCEESVCPSLLTIEYMQGHLMVVPDHQKNVCLCMVCN